MNSEISINNRYYAWNKIINSYFTCWWKGTLFYENELLHNDEVASLFSTITKDLFADHELVEDLLNNVNGNFSLVIETPLYIFCAVDLIRSIPIFYTNFEDNFIVSDDANYLRVRIKSSFNEESGAEFMITGFVTGSETLFHGISQLQAGEYLIYDKERGSIRISYYHRYWHGDYLSDSENDLLNRIDETLIRVFRRLIKSTKGLKIVVPLSGGLDSRIVVTMLKRLGVEDLICFSYGKKGNKEAQISERVAEALDYQWIFIEDTKEELFNCYHSEEMRKFFIYSGNLVSTPHTQDFLAVMKMRDAGKIPKNSVFVPGHTGDVLAGSHIPLDYNKPQSYDLKKFLDDNLEKHYLLWKWDRAKNGSIFKNRILKSVGNPSVCDKDSCANAIEMFDFNERQAKYIINSVRVYEFFGYHWRIPLWDKELINLFLKIPLSYRIYQYIYKKYARERLLSHPQIECTTDFSGRYSARSKYQSALILLSFHWNLLNDIRWYQFSRHPILFRICIRNGINPLNIIRYSNNVTWIKAIYGALAKDYLEQILKK